MDYTENEKKKFLLLYSLYLFVGIQDFGFVFKPTYI